MNKLALAGALTACGGSGSNPTTSASLAELGAAKRAGEEKARERDRVKNLQKQMRALKRQVKRRKSSPASARTSRPSSKMVQQRTHRCSRDSNHTLKDGVPS